jgi:hypothetical protein
METRWKECLSVGGDGDALEGIVLSTGGDVEVAAEEHNVVMHTG